MRSLVTSIFVNACESWNLTAELQRRIQAIKMRCYHKILRISYKDHVTNEEVSVKIQIRSHKDLTIVKRHKLQWYGHVSVHQVWPKPSCKAQWKREEDKADRKKRWEVNTKKWTGLEFAKSQRAVENRKERGKNGVNCMWSHLWCFNDPHG